MSYRENPKTAGSGVVCCIPQTGHCPMGCVDCFFQSGRSYLEPLMDNTPNMPDEETTRGRVVRVNDGNDSCYLMGEVIEETEKYGMRFYNTSIPRKDLRGFNAPVVLTANPDRMTDRTAQILWDIPPNLMFVRARTNTWNTDVVDKVVNYYSEHDVPIVLTFMAYFTEDIPPDHKENYAYRMRTLNSYNAITTEAWEQVMARYKHNKWVYSCGKIEGEKGTTACRHCGNCLREYFATMERLR